MVERHENYQRIVESIRRNLVNFGYAGLTTEEVLASYDKAINGEQPSGIIDLMTKSQLEQNGLLEE